MFKHDLFDVLIFSLTTGFLPLSFHKAVITLIPKKGDIHDISNWRPVSLLNTDYKIFAKLLANRLKQHIGNVIHLDQTYCIPNRTIYDNLNLIRDIIHFSNSSNSPLAVVNLDQKKAFDNVDHGYLFSTMRAMGFGNNFLTYLRLLYSGAESHIKVCGGLTAPFPFQKGIRQGCPLSGLLYSIAIEPFLHNLRKQLDQCSFTIPNSGKVCSVSAYADDISIFVTSDVGFDINRIYNLYSRSSAASLNYTKSQGLWAGPWIGRSDKPLNFQWNDQGLRFLGVHLGNYNHYVKQNWTNCSEKLNRTLSRWTPLSSSLSLKGKVLIANQLAATQVFHSLAVLCPPEDILSGLQRRLVDFVLSGKRHLLEKEKLFQPCNHGGLGLACLRARSLTFKFALIQRFHQHNPHPCYLLMDYNLRLYKRLDLSHQLFLLDLEPKFFTSVPCFYGEVLRAWVTSGARMNTSLFSVNDILEIPMIYAPLVESFPGGPAFCARL